MSENKMLEEMARAERGARIAKLVCIAVAAVAVIIWIMVMGK